jgi:AcrR family transcriptional regulator
VSPLFPSGVRPSENSVSIETVISLCYPTTVIPSRQASRQASAQRSPQEATEPRDLRSRKKERTRLAIEDAALELFAEEGYEATTVDQIAERAEVSKATFFRYFATKGEVIFGRERDQHLDLQEAIVGRPPSEADLTAVLCAIRERWVPTLDPDRTARQTRAARTSPVLRGLSFDLGLRLQLDISDAIARRRGLDVPDQRCRLVAGMAFAALSNGVNSWMDDGGSGDLGTAIDRAFELATELCRDIEGLALGS